MSPWYVFIDNSVLNSSVGRKVTGKLWKINFSAFASFGAFTEVNFQVGVLWAVMLCSVVVTNVSEIRADSVDLWNAGILPQHYTVSAFSSIATGLTTAIRFPEGSVPHHVQTGFVVYPSFR
jgi:hypothetical protein